MIMAQETRNVDYESMVDKYMNEWEGCNLLQVVIKRCSPEVLVRLIHKMKEVC